MNQVRQSNVISQGDEFINSNLFLSRSEIEQSARWIESIQLESGLIPWHTGGHIDPWNHIESVIALAIGGRRSAAIRGLNGLAELQNRDGSFCHFYLYNGVKEADRDPNVISYLGVGILALSSIFDIDFVQPYTTMLIEAINYVVSIQRPDGLMPALLTPDGSEKGRPLRAANCSIMTSLEAAITFGEMANVSSTLLHSWRASLVTLRRSYLVSEDEKFAATNDWAMDWYYPILAMARIEGEDLTDLFASGLERFFVRGLGVKCKASNSWFTAAETAEAAIAALILGRLEDAHDIFSTLGRFRSDDGGYTTGIVEPQGVTFPPFEESSYTTAAVLIASSLLSADLTPSSFTKALLSLRH